MEEKKKRMKPQNVQIADFNTGQILKTDYRKFLVARDVCNEFWSFCCFCEVLFAENIINDWTLVDSTTLVKNSLPVVFLTFGLLSSPLQYVNVQL